MKYFGGVEGGATHSNLVICNEHGDVVGKAKGLGTNHWTLGIEECAARVLLMLHEAKQDAGLPSDHPLDCLGLTLSGCEQESSNAELAARVKEKDAASARAIYVASDTAGSLFTGAPDGGMVLIAGTGSNALLRTPNGNTYGCGGWGYLLGDEGGAYWIAHKAVKAVFDDEDGLCPAPHPTDRVWAAIKEHFNAETRADLLPHAYKHFDKSKFAGVTAKLSSLAFAGDQLSQHIFEQAGAALAAHAAALATRVDGRVRVVCVGSVWRSWRYLRPGLLAHLAQAKVDVELELVRLRVSSAMGAAWLAAKHVDFELPRDDSAFCEVFYTYKPGTYENMNGANEALNGANEGVNGTKGLNGTNGVNYCKEVNGIKEQLNGTKETNGIGRMNGTNGVKMNGFAQNGTDKDSCDIRNCS